jgi:hypothetical protein
VYRTYDYLCRVCEGRFGELFERDSQPETHDCICGGVADLTIGAPMPLRKSYHDGYKRGGDYQLLKEASQLEKKMYNLPHEKRREMQKEIQTLKKRTTQESTRNKGKE